MPLFTISDLHLSLNANKSMSVFKGWDNYVERLTANWNRIVKPSDTVVLPGDLSWALKLPDAKADFTFLNDLPGQKILLKGNHDLWWGTVKKMNEFLNENHFNTITVLFNNAIKIDNYAICGTRGWFYDDPEGSKVLLREAGRLEASIKAAMELGGEPLLFLHYPPVYGDVVCKELFNIVKNYEIKTIYHGHIHGAGFHNAVSEYDGVKFKLISADCVQFTPVLITKTM